jgi:methanogenic corrinoid protein MtbC1/DNA-binding XRE family transcriptional regulator
MSDFATSLRELRRRRGLRQVDLAEALGIAQTTVANYEKKLRFPDEQMLDRFADFFNVSLDFLMGRSRLEREPGAPGAAGPAARVPLSENARRYLEMLRGNHAEEASALVEAAIRSGSTLSQVYLQVLEPALKETGRLWERGELRVGEEHAITLATQSIMSRIFVAPESGSRGAAAPVCLVLAASGEPHIIGPTMVTDLLRADGWEVLFPGGNLSIRHTLELLDLFAPKLVALSVTISEHVAGAADLVAAVRERDRTRGPRIMVGGQAFQASPSLWREVGADATAGDAAAAVLIANKLIINQQESS